VRDMVDLDGLLRHFGMTPGFWEALPHRARELDLAQPMALACHFCTNWLETPVPELASQALKATAGLESSRSTLVRILRTALLPLEPDEAPSWRTLAAGALVQARHHRWRLPLAQTVTHLLRKTLDRPRAH
jgi:hypothetical protein